MADFLIQLSLFSAKAIILLIVILALVFGLLAIIINARQKTTGRLSFKNINEKLEENKLNLLIETLPKKEYKAALKAMKTVAKEKESKKQPIIYLLHFNGDIKASAVEALREEITTILSVAKPEDEVVLSLESPGGVVHGYGLAAAQLLRLRQAKIKLTVIIDKVAASGGYLMACVADRILAAPFAIIGSIGVIVQIPNFHRLLQDKHIDFEMQTAGEYKRTLTLFGENTEAGRKKLKEELEDIHLQFKKLIADHRPQLDIAQVATGEHWLGEHALSLKLVDELTTSDAYLLHRSNDAKIIEVYYEMKKPLIAKLTGAGANLLIEIYDRLFRVNRAF